MNDEQKKKLLKNNSFAAKSSIAGLKNEKIYLRRSSMDKIQKENLCIMLEIYKDLERYVIVNDDGTYSINLNSIPRELLIDAASAYMSLMEGLLNLNKITKKTVDTFNLENRFVLYVKNGLSKSTYSDVEAVASILGVSNDVAYKLVNHKESDPLNIDNIIKVSRKEKVLKDYFEQLIKSDNDSIIDGFKFNISNIKAFEEKHFTINRDFLLKTFTNVDVGILIKSTKTTEMDHKVKLIKIIRELTGLGLIEAKKIVDVEIKNKDNQIFINSQMDISELQKYQKRLVDLGFSCETTYVDNIVGKYIEV